MAKRGPKGKPTARKRLEGNRGHRKLPDNEVEPRTGIGDAPVYFGNVAKWCWNYHKDVLECIGLLTAADVVQFTQFCLAVDELATIQKMYAKQEPVLEGEKGGMYQNPLFTTRNILRKQIDAFASRFGLTPQDRIGWDAEQLKKFTNQPEDEGVRTRPR